MKNLLSTLTLLTSFLITVAQPLNDGFRSLAEEDLRPFYHGVASGDPTENSVIIWTRVTTENMDEAVDVTWRISTDTAFTDTLQSGVFNTSADRDFTVKIDVQGLEPNTYYYYEFEYNGKNSLIGRTKTTPSNIDNIDQLRFAIVSCSNYPTGFFTVYEKIAERNDIDAVLHLGDYIYEYANTFFTNPRRRVMPDHEIVELADYRLRHATYKLDEDSRKMHQHHPIISTWDDHESTNNSYKDGAENHDASEGDWQARKQSSMKAYYEWMPIRLPDEDNQSRIWRNVKYGNLAELFVLDTRLYDRDEQGGNINAADKKLLGPEQMDWLLDGLSNSEAQWKIIAQQVMMAQLIIPDLIQQDVALVVNDDQWDGYPAERNKLYNHLEDNEIDNVVVLTGDIHTTWAADLPKSMFDYNPQTGEKSLAVEFVTTSVTSQSAPFPIPAAVDIITTFLPQFKHVDLSRKGYTLLDITDEKTQGDFITVNTIQSSTSDQKFRRGYYTLDGENHLNRADTATIDERDMAVFPPNNPRINTDTTDTTTVTNINQLIDADVLNIYPNPFVDQFVVELHLFKNSDVKLALFNSKGQSIINKDFGRLNSGRNWLDLNNLVLSSGIYEVIISVDDALIKRSVVKIE